ncbi:NADH-quinone oxidoreductase subunit 5 family protein [Stetteria hydrogenophila]
MSLNPTLIWALPYLGAGLLAVFWLAGCRREWVYAWTSVAAILASAVAATTVAYDVLAHGRVIHVAYDWIPWVNVDVGTYVDGLSAVMSLVVAWLSFLIALYSVDYMRGDWGVQRYFFFITFFVGSMLLLVLADNLVLMLIGWEGTGIASYALISHWYTDEEEYWVGVPGRRVLGAPMYSTPSQSGLRAILYTRLGDAGLFTGAALIYSLTGTFSIPVIAEKAPQWMTALASGHYLTAALLVFTLGAIAKSAQFPFHEWLVTAMTGPTPASALIHAATMVKAGVYFMLRFTPIFYTGALAAGSPVVIDQVRAYFEAIAGLGAFTAFATATMALVSNEFKLILAFSTASQLGYMFLAAGAAGALLGSNPESFAFGVAAGLAHLVSHAVFKAALFLIAGWAIHVAHSRFIDHMGGYARYMKATAAAMWLAGLSLAGIPPLSGFFSKEMTLEAAREAHLTWAYALGVATAALTAAYTLRLILRVLHLPPYEEAHGEPREAPPLMLAPYMALALAALVLGLAWGGVEGVLSKAWGVTLAVHGAPGLGFELTTGAVATLGLALASMAAVAGLYLVARVDFRRVLASSRAARILHDFLFDRWYVNSLTYLVVVGGFTGVALALAAVDSALDWLYHTGLVSAFAAFSLALALVDSAVDRFYHGVVVEGAAAISMALRGLHRGRPDYYLALYASMAGLVMLLALIAWG